MEKPDLRERVWDELEDSGEARFPFPPHGRIPNFAGAEQAAERLAETAVWEEADVIKSNPDSPQRPVRRLALEAGKVVYMAVPRLQDEKCFLRLDPDEIEDIDHATTIGGSSELGVKIAPEEMEAIDVVVSGSVAVTERGARVGKGEGYSDLEFGVLREFDCVNDETTTATTVHKLQVLDHHVPTESHDVPMDLVVTPERTVRTGAAGKPGGVDWARLDDDDVAAMPVLATLER